MGLQNSVDISDFAWIMVRTMGPGMRQAWCSIPAPGSLASYGSFTGYLSSPSLSFLINGMGMIIFLLHMVMVIE